MLLYSLVSLNIACLFLCPLHLNPLQPLSSISYTIYLVSFFLPLYLLQFVQTFVGFEFF